jgi:hypothetical protein
MVVFNLLSEYQEERRIKQYYKYGDDVSQHYLGLI